MSHVCVVCVVCVSYVCHVCVMCVSCVSHECVTILSKCVEALALINMCRSISNAPHLVCLRLNKKSPAVAAPQGVGGRGQMGVCVVGEGRRGGLVCITCSHLRVCEKKGVRGREREFVEEKKSSWKRFREAIERERKRGRDQSHDGGGDGESCSGRQDKTRARYSIFQRMLL